MYLQNGRVICSTVESSTLISAAFYLAGRALIANFTSIDDSRHSKLHTAALDFNTISDSEPIGGRLDSGAF